MGCVLGGMVFSVSTLYCFQFLEFDNESNIEWNKIMRQSGEDVRKNKEHGKLFLFVILLARKKGGCQTWYDECRSKIYDMNAKKCFLFCIR